MANSKIIWTEIDEAPALATYCLLPVVQAFTKNTGIDVESKDISLSGRIIANFPDNLKEEQKISDYLTELGELAKTPEANIIKLPNISASIPQLQAAIKELQEKGFDIPDYPEEPKNDEEKALHLRFAKVLGSAVNPVLREGNSDRRPAISVKKFAQKNPHRMMKPWPESGSKARVSFMKEGDFYGNEIATTLEEPTDVRFEFVDKNGNVTILKDKLSLQKGEILDATKMTVRLLRDFYEEQFQETKKDGSLLSLHLKATMMKVSDPIMFGHAVSVFYKTALDKHETTLKEIGVNLSNGLQDVYDKLNRLPEDKRAEIEADIMNVYKERCDISMVDSRSGITNLHVPNNVIVDASMPNVVRDGGKMWNNNDQLQDTNALIPDRCYSTIYATIIEDAKVHGQFDPSTMGNVANVGLMAQKAEEYGSHDKTFESADYGTIRIVKMNGDIVLEREVEKGDIFRACQVKDEPVKDWVKLAVRRAKATGSPAIFWLDENRAHDREVIKKVNLYLPECDTTGLEIKIMKPIDAMKFTLERVRKGLDTISVTGNALRDYLTDLFPILELGTSARMLSIVPLLNGGGLFETGAGGSAPKHVQQLVKEGHLRWDSLGEYCALVPSFEMIYEKTKNPFAQIMAETLDAAVGTYLENARYPSRKVNEIDNRGSSYYLSMYWAEALANQTKDAELSAKFAPVAKALAENEAKINEELLAAQGKPVDLGGYYKPDTEKTTNQMRPSKTWNAIIDAL
jgi:isocitrate dehydrogenase